MLTILQIVNDIAEPPHATFVSQLSAATIASTKMSFIEIEVAAKTDDYPQFRVFSLRHGLLSAARGRSKPEHSRDHSAKLIHK